LCKRLAQAQFGRAQVRAAIEQRRMGDGSSGTAARSLASDQGVPARRTVNALRRSTRASISALCFPAPCLETINLYHLL